MHMYVRYVRRRLAAVGGVIFVVRSIKSGRLASALSVTVPTATATNPLNHCFSSARFKG